MHKEREHEISEVGGQKMPEPMKAWIRERYGDAAISEVERFLEQNPGMRLTPKAFAGMPHPVGNRRERRAAAAQSRKAKRR